MDPEIIKELEDKMRARHRELRKEMKILDNELREGLSGNSAEALSLREEADVIEEESFLEEKEINLIEDALARIEEGTYGKCLACGKEINTERLRAMPSARYCVKCQSGRE
ncbi:MAG: TraR/DksA C4-type zinc finger protein [Candidatus Omnitrophota bacterium]